MADADTLADELIELTSDLVAELHPAIAGLALPGHFERGCPRRRCSRTAGRWRARPAEAAPVAAAGGAACGRGRRDRPRPAWIRQAGRNPLLPALALAAFYLVEARRSGAFELGALATGRVRVYPLAPDEAHHDPPLLPGTAAIRAWFPVAGVAEACVELRLHP